MSGVALVTGAARRIGRAIALALGRSGYDVAVHYREAREEAAQLVGELQALGRRAWSFRADFEDLSSCGGLVESVVSAGGRLDVLINNASLFARLDGGGLEPFDAGQWSRMLRVNLEAPAALCHHAGPYLAERDGCIVNLGDVAAEVPWPGYLSYGVSKSGLVGLTRGLARGMAPRVRVNAVSPGIAVFPEDFPVSRRKALIARVPLGRAGSAEEIAHVVRFLVSDATYMTGQVIVVDGGRSLG